MYCVLLFPNLQWLCLLLFFMSVSVGATPEEGAILLNWRNNMTHSGVELANWDAAGSSDPGGSEGNWSHVSCDNTGYVQRLDLHSLGLSGTLAPELGLFSKLETLSLYNNTFSRSIPPEMGNLSTLVLLDLSENQLSGPIPDTLAKLTNLQHLTLNNNKFSGSFPESLARLPGLSSINLDSNSISGVLNVTRLFEVTEATSTIYLDKPLGVVNLMNNNVTNVAFQPSNLLNTRSLELLLSKNFFIFFHNGLQNLYEETNIDSWCFHKRCLLKTLNILFMNHSLNQCFKECLFIDKIICYSLSLCYSVNIHMNLYSLLLMINKIQGNPYCSGSMELYDDGRRCFCQQNCSITTMQQGL